MHISVIFLLALSIEISQAYVKENKYLDICSSYNVKKFYVEFGASGELLADSKNQVTKTRLKYNEDLSQKKCSVELITCPSCVIEIKFKFLDIPRTCGKSSIFAHCSCDYVLIHEPRFESASEEQFCGKFIQNNVSKLTYFAQTRSTTVDFVFSYDYGRAFSLEFSAKRNQIIFEGYPTTGRTNNASQFITSPFFPLHYPPDLSSEYVIKCSSKNTCRISLLFTDFLLAHSSIIEFFDWNGQRMYVISGNVFRPPIIVTSGPSLTMRFYANGASDLGFKASYTFFLESSDGAALEPNTDCGGEVNNLGGGITMMNMIKTGVKFFDCVWIVKTPSNFLHRKTHLYVKVVNFTNFARTTELIIRQGISSNEAAVEILKYPITRFNSVLEKEHVAPINEGFYISLRGLFRPESQLAIVYAAFNYEDCFSGLDFLCQNLRCISALLNCDGFDHCGDNSDELLDYCSKDPRDHRQYSKIPNFLFPKVESYSNLTTATFVFLLCTFGLIGIIFAMALLLYRVNTRERHQRQIQDHIHTIHAILDEGVGDGEEEIIIPDEPPDYEPPPEYSDVFKYIRIVAYGNKYKYKSSQRSVKPYGPTSVYATSSRTSSKLISPVSNDSPECSLIHRNNQAQTVNAVDTAPPAYENYEFLEISQPSLESCENRDTEGEAHGPTASHPEGSLPDHAEAESLSDLPDVNRFSFSTSSTIISIEMGMSSKCNIQRCKSAIFSNNYSRKSSAEDPIKYFSDSELHRRAKRLTK